MIEFKVPRLEARAMRLPAPTIAEILKLIEMHLADSRRAAERSHTDRVMTRQELIKHGLLSDRYVN